MGEDIYKWWKWQWINFQNIQTVQTTQKPTSNPAKKKGKKLIINTLFLQRRYIDEQQAHKKIFDTTSY